MSDSVRPQRRQPTRLLYPWDSPGKNTGVGCHFLLQCMKVKSESQVAQSCPTLSDPMDCSLPGFSIHGIFQARVLEWGAIAFRCLEKATIIHDLFQKPCNFSPSDSLMIHLSTQSFFFPKCKVSMAEDLGVKKFTHQKIKTTHNPNITKYDHQYYSVTNFSGFSLCLHIHICSFLKSQINLYYIYRSVVCVFHPETYYKHFSMLSNIFSAHDFFKAT